MYTCGSRGKGRIEGEEDHLYPHSTVALAIRFSNGRSGLLLVGVIVLELRCQMWLFTPSVVSRNFAYFCYRTSYFVNF